MPQQSRAKAGKRLSGRTRRGSPWLRSALIEAAQAAARTKGSYLSAQYHRLAARRKKKAAVAVTPSSSSHLLSRDEPTTNSAPATSMSAIGTRSSDASSDASSASATRWPSNPTTPRYSLPQHERRERPWWLHDSW